MKIDEDKFRKFCEDNKVEKHNEYVLRKLCYLVANDEIVMTTVEEDLIKVSKIDSTITAMWQTTDYLLTKEIFGKWYITKAREVII